MKKRMFAMLCCVALLLGLMMSNGYAESDEEAVSGKIKEWLSKDCSFSISMDYRNIAIDGFSHNIRQDNGVDGSFHFLSAFRQWDHPAEYEYEDKTEYYYQYEDGNLVCYVRMNDQEPVRGVLTAEVTEEIMRDKQKVVGAKGLLPDYMTNAEYKPSEEDETLAVYTYQLPLKAVLQDGGMLSSFVQNAIMISGKMDAVRQDVHILAKFTVEADTLKPISLTFDFGELKPHLFSEGALSGEFALGMDLMKMQYTFDYQLEKQIPVPQEFIPDGQGTL